PLARRRLPLRLRQRSHLLPPRLPPHPHPAPSLPLCALVLDPFPARRVRHSFPTRRSSDLSTSSWASTCFPRSRKAAASPGSTIPDRKSTRLNSSHQIISYAVFCLKKKRPSARLRVYTGPARSECHTATTIATSRSGWSNCQ